MDFLLQVNTSVQYFKDKFQDPTFFMQVPLQVATERAIAQLFANASLGADAPQLAWQVATSMFAHPTTNSINVVSIGSLHASPRSIVQFALSVWPATCPVHPLVCACVQVGKSIGSFIFAANLFTFVLIVSSLVVGSGTTIIPFAIGPHFYLP